MDFRERSCQSTRKVRLPMMHRIHADFHYESQSIESRYAAEATSCPTPRTVGWQVDATTAT